MKQKPEKFHYGKSKSPTNWQESSEALASLRKNAPKPRKNGVIERLDRLEQSLKETK